MQANKHVYALRAECFLYCVKENENCLYFLSHCPLTNSFLLPLLQPVLALLEGSCTKSLIVSKNKNIQPEKQHVR